MIVLLSQRVSIAMKEARNLSERREKMIDCSTTPRQLFGKKNLRFASREKKLREKLSTQKVDKNASPTKPRFPPAAAGQRNIDSQSSRGQKRGIPIRDTAAIIDDDGQVVGEEQPEAKGHQVKGPSQRFVAKEEIPFEINGGEDSDDGIESAVTKPSGIQKKTNLNKRESLQAIETRTREIFNQFKPYTNGI